MNIGVIGPLSPYKGGIAHSNTILCQNLSARHTVVAVSFSRMFPEFLYPGRSQKDPDAAPPTGLAVLQLLDSLNPVTWVRTCRRLREAGCGLVVFQWWSPFFAPCYTAIAWLARRLGMRVSVVCQNVGVHEQGLRERLLARPLTRLFFQQADYFITYSSSDKADLKRLLPGARAAYVVEGTYDLHLGTRIPKEEAQKALGFTGRNLLFFGFVREYKGLSYLLQALPEVLKRQEVTLHIVGEFWEGKEQYLQQIERLGIGRQVRIVDRYVSDEEAVRYFSAADAVVLPYVSSTESGIIQLAYGMTTPVITTDVGGNKDLIDHGRSGLLVRPRDPADLAAAITAFYARRLEAPIKRQMRKKLRIFRWTPEKERVFLGDF